MSKSQSQQKSDLSITPADAASIGQRIRQLRGADTVTEFARRLGIRRESLSRIERGVLPAVETLWQVARVTGASLDFLVLGVASTAHDAAAGWDAELTRLIAGTSLRLVPPSSASRRRAERAWQGLPDDRKDEIRALVRQTALVAGAIEGLLPARAARPVIDELGEALTALVVDRIVGPARRPLS
jgi:transcriptional regulator with XRE-family HTH domain